MHRGVEPDPQSHLGAPLSTGREEAGAAGSLGLLTPGMVLANLQGSVQGLLPRG